MAKTYFIDEDAKPTDDYVINLKDGDRVIIARNVRTIYHTCCNCGVKHIIHTKTKKGKIILKFQRR